MRIGMLGCAAALTLLGTAAAQAEMVYVGEPGVVATAPGYTCSVPGPLPGSRFVVTEPASAIVAEPTYAEWPQTYVVDQARPYLFERPRTVVTQPRIVAPREPVVVAPRVSGIVTTGYSTVRSCFTDLAGVERY